MTTRDPERNVIYFTVKKRREVEIGAGEGDLVCHTAS
jgi:hypothetical protein